MWDLRIKENSGCVHSITGSVGDIIYAVSNSSTGNVAIGGADRTVTIYDPRRLVVLRVIATAIKYSSCSCETMFVKKSHFFLGLLIWPMPLVFHCFT